LGLRGFLAKSAPDRFNVDQLPPGFLDWFLDESGKTSVPALARFVPLMASIDTRPDLGKIQVPTLIVAPGDDPLTPLEYVRPFVDSIPDARLVVFEGMRHNITDGVPERCAAELLKFLQGVSVGA
ncbi:MAG: alpha/beta hydrolase, partial [Chloroflexi bacterium]|nr:alpha/beta hydrolase [Chloroflexota bacterium]